MRLCKLHLGREVSVIRALWHIGCQSELNELVSLASRPADRGFDRMAETKVPFHPVKCGLGRMAEPSRSFRPVKCGFGRMGTQLEVFARRKHTTNH